MKAEVKKYGRPKVHVNAVLLWRLEGCYRIGIDCKEKNPEVSISSRYGGPSSGLNQVTACLYGPNGFKNGSVDFVAVNVSPTTRAEREFFKDCVVIDHRDKYGCTIHLVPQVAAEAKVTYLYPHRVEKKKKAAR
jgi:hypothetical protein